MFVVQKHEIYNFIHFLNRYFKNKIFSGYIIWTKIKFTYQIKTMYCLWHQILQSGPFLAHGLPSLRSVNSLSTTKEINTLYLRDPEILSSNLDPQATSFLIPSNSLLTYPIIWPHLLLSCSDGSQKKPRTKQKDGSYQCTGRRTQHHTMIIHNTGIIQPVL
jgi:hypothetical protein